jgi:hypothetical protein
MSVARRSAAAVACAAGSVALLALQRVLLETAARLQSPVDLFFDPKRPVTAELVRGLPYHVVDAVFAPPASIHAALIVVGLLQALVLYGLYRALGGREVSLGERIALGIAAAAMIAVALDARAVNGFDTVADVGYAKLGLAQAYAPPATPFGADFSTISAVWGVPMLPASHGPGWIALSSAVAGRAASLGGAIFALRSLEVVALLGMLALLARRGATAAVLALVAFNPALYFAYVVNAHGDLLAAVLLIAALAAAASLPIVAAVLVACAGLLNLPLILAAPLVFAGRGALRARLAYAVLAVVLALAASLWLGGRVYFDLAAAQLHAVFVPADRAGAVATAVRCGLLVVAAFALVNAFVRGLVRRAAAWSFVALAPLIAPAALAGTLPYAVLARPVLTELLILLPVAAALLDVSFPRPGLGVVATAAMLAYAIFDAVRRRAVPVDAS